MDTWWKRAVYSKWLKGISFTGILITGFIFFISFIGICTTSSSKDYFDSYEFEKDFVAKAGYVRDWIVRYDEEKIFNTVTEEEIQAYKEKAGDNLSDEAAIAGIVTDRKSYFSTIQNELITNNKNLDYLAIDSSTNRIVTNMEMTNAADMIKDLTSRSNYLEGNGYGILNYRFGLYKGADSNGISYLYREKYYTGRTFEEQNNYHIYVALKENLEAGDEFYNGFMNFKVNKLGRYRLMRTLIVTGITGVLLVIYYLSVAGRRERKGKVILNAFDRIPLEVQIVLSILGIVAGIGAINQYGYNADLSSVIIFTSTGTVYQWMVLAVLGTISMTVIAFEMLCLSSWIKHIKNKSMLEHIGSFLLIKKFYYSKENKRKIFILVGIIAGINFAVELLMIVTTDFIWSSFYLIIRPVLWSLFLGGVLLKLLLDYHKILAGAKEISQGNLDKKIEFKKTVPMFEELATTINSMGTGLEKAVGESIKSERLKTELITNVSHDLKTPLTSIISYIDLLKEEQIHNQIAKEYIDILDERSHRLKQLVEDLVDASKAVTGNVKANVEVLGLDQLVGQAVGEYTDRIEASGLNLMMNKMEEVWIMGDGRHMWRVIENLLSNVCKYALPHTRVYIEVYEEDGSGYCTIKNISREALNINPDELTERFVRGDAARTTEGSGLGLAIAQSLVLIQQGQLNISIDGDLFKVSIKMPLAEKEETVLLNKDDLV